MFISGLINGFYVMVFTNLKENVELGIKGTEIINKPKS